MAPYVVPPEHIAMLEQHHRAGASRGSPGGGGPIKAGTIRLRWIGGSQHHHVVGLFIRRDARVFACTQTIHCTRHRELRGAQAINEISAANRAAFFQRLQYPVDTCEPAPHMLCQHSFARHHTVTFQ